ncbi:multiple sugar transport system permease protein [Scopulibacillus daqui]|uniref:Multiple sugar transport system permease protein n=1 Tax=Scopulibacillus daqui TaxID=1469162 RepID=A0ABS2Q3D7_9BACL|nr:carbohydrate ABC transporter permease [Scopulibacillus daqui]MBM7646189.1 multiple sugar transport system permease protein [Scopulibacillus daqui]
MKKRIDIGGLLVHIFLWAGLIIVVFPFVWMILSSFKSLPDFYHFSFLPDKLNWSGYKYIFEETDYLRWYLNSIVVAVVVTISCLIFNSLIGYVLAKYRFPGAKAIFIVILSTLMIPTELLVIPWYVAGSKLHWVNTYWGLMLPGMIEAFGVFLMRQFMMSIPDDILDAARIDGMGELRIWWRIALPQVRQAMAAMGIITFLGNWNAYLWPVIATSTANMRTLPVGISLYSTADAGGIQWHVIMGMSTLAVIPMMIVFLIFQKKIVEGISLTGVKG